MREDDDVMPAQDDDQLLMSELIAWPPEEFVLPLRQPVTHAGETFTEVTLREPTGLEWEKILAQPEGLRRRFAVSHIGGVPMAACALIGIGDLVRGENYLNSFFEVGQVIGVS